MASAGGKQGGDDDGYGMLYGLIILFIIGVALYHFLHTDVIKALFFVKAAELHVLSYFFPYFDSLLAWVKSVKAQNVTMVDLKYLSLDIGTAIRWPLSILAIVLAIIIYIFHPKSSFIGTESMHSLEHKLRKVFTAVQIVYEFDLVNTDINNGPWAMALTPIEFAKKHKLLTKNRKTGANAINTRRAKLIFSQQLGRPWTGIDDLSKPERAIFAALAAYVNYQRDTGEELLNKIAASASKKNIESGDLEYFGVEKILSRFGQSIPVNAIVAKHAYVNTVFAGMLQAARTTGIIANSSYLWIKPLERSLWYTLNNVGRKAVFIEAGAIRAHFLAECAVNQPLGFPMVDSAITSLVDAIENRVIS